MCSCTTHHWLARPVTALPGDHAITGTSTEHAAACSAGLAAALAVRDHRTTHDDTSPLLLEIVVDHDVIAWLPVTPVHGHLPDREDTIRYLETIHAAVLTTSTSGLGAGHELTLALPELPTTALHVDLDPTPDTEPHLHTTGGR